MKTLSTLLLSAFLLLSGHVYAAAPVAADTLKGQKLFIQHVSQSVCNKLNEEEKKKPLNKLSPEEGQALLEEALQSSMREHIDEMSAIMKANKVSKPRKFGEMVGREVVIVLLQECPLSQQLFASVGMSAMKGKPTIAPEEKPVLTLVSTEICQRLDTENAKSAISGRPKAERKQIIENAMQGSILKHLEALSNYYGLKQIQNTGHMETVGRKIALLLVDQCPNYLMQMGLDEVTEN
ncbi:hypothetical protein KBK19_03265 [Microvirga sp. STR05]|uniref:Secreted protein n=1 Tax=Hymenobacter duratus TaxID=2771356 RepID=A0ABR8JBG9_9BACT|nr:hypothetical protein [Hymenobacter duratus]MBD2714049.1 hypothetical protein [Hymenobacter duratus]MBR7948951.1 hypothetical protein [Microvirga sp. STR05]